MVSAESGGGHATHAFKRMLTNAVNVWNLANWNT